MSHPRGATSTSRPVATISKYTRAVLSAARLMEKMEWAASTVRTSYWYLVQAVEPRCSKEEGAAATHVRYLVHLCPRQKQWLSGRQWRLPASLLLTASDV